jgi:assimilatory nitrate reductase catalytic subunit
MSVISASVDSNVTRSTCAYCGVGCGVLIETRGEEIIDVRGDPDHPANHGRLCTKGSTLHLSRAPETRLRYPAMRSQREARLARSDWEATLAYLADRFAETIKAHGPDSVAFYISGQLLTEDYYVFNKLAKGLIGTNNIDTNSRLCMSSAVAGYKATLGADAPPTCYEDIEHAQCVFIAGSNTAYAHPILYRRLEEARRKNPAMRVIVVDPRLTDTAREADLFLPLAPGSDVALFNGMLHVMIRDGLCDFDFIARATDGFDALTETARGYPPEVVESICGISTQDLTTAAHWFASSGATLSLYCQGLNQSSQGTDKNAALINLHLATGQIGKPGAGPFSLTGQPNAMGGREVGGMANLLSAHRDMANPSHRREIAALWGVDDVPAAPGKTAVEMFEAVRSGEIKILWIACTNPAQSMPHQAIIREALEKAELVVLQEAFRGTETAAYADVLLPASAWGEKDGTVTNSERRVTRVRPAVAAPGEARHDWWIAAEFARRLQSRLPRVATKPLFPYETAEAIFDEHVATTRGRDLDITGLTYRLLETSGPQQWPFPAGASSGKQRLYEDEKFPTASGRARFYNASFRGVAEEIDRDFPLRLNTGRLRDQWHGMSRTGKVARLFNHAPEPVLSLNATDAASRKLASSDIAAVKSRRGEVMVRVEISDQVRRGEAFLPMHWGGEFMGGLGVNALTVSDFDPISKQPELKHAAIEVERVSLPWQFTAIRRLKAGDDDAGPDLAVLEKLKPVMAGFAFSSVGLYGRDTPLLVVHGAARARVPPALIEALDALLKLDDPDNTMQYEDSKRAISKRVLLRQGCIVGARLCGETAARSWLKELMAEGGEAGVARSWLLAPLATPPAAATTRGRIVCNCHDVAASEILACATEGLSLVAVQAKLKCGTECGSCLPEVKSLVGADRKAA